MLSRIVSVLIVGFWMVMSGLLVRKIWFPAESGLAEVSPQAVYELFAARGETSTLDVYRDRQKIGTLRITPTGAATPAGRSDGPGRLSVRGRIALGSETGDRARELDIASSFGLGADGDLSRTMLRMDLNRPRLSLRVEQPDPESPGTIELKHNGAVLLSGSTESLTESDSHPLLGVLLASVGLRPADLAAAREEAEAVASGFSARHGLLEVDGRKVNGYVLSSAAPGRPGVRAYIDNAGQLLKIETPFGYSLLSQEAFPREDRGDD